MVEYIGIDIGGTNIRIGTMDEKKNVNLEYKELTLKNVKTSEDLYKKIRNLILKIPNYNNVKAIGIGVPGSIDIESNKIITCRNLRVLKDYPIVQNLYKDFNIPIYIENDARVAALAEAIKGKGKDKRIVVYITISTGLGGGLIIDKDIYKGANGLGTYLSRMILDGQNISEELISGTALIKQAKREISENINNASEVFELEKNNNLKAKEIIERFKRNLTILLLNISVRINPDIIILGGGVVKSKDRFLDDVIRAFRKEAHSAVTDTIIDIAEFKEPGIVGAALLAKNELNKELVKFW